MRGSRDPRKRKFADARFERGDEVPVFDVVAEGIEPDLGGVKKRLGRAKQTLRVVDDAKFFQRHSVWNASLPDAQCFQRLDRARQQRRGAVVRLCPRRNQERSCACRLKCNGADKAGRSAADNGNFARERGNGAVHTVNRSLRRGSPTNARPLGFMIERQAVTGTFCPIFDFTCNLRI